MWFLVFLGGVAAVAFAALGEYVGGRILFPSLGLGVPQYWTWFWFMVVSVVFAGPIWILKKAVID